MPDPVGRVKACTECRQQKVRCDAYLDYSRPCTRCRAGKLPCIISKDFQRRKRQSKAQLQHEIDRLKAKVDGDAEGEGEGHSGPNMDEFTPSARSDQDSRHVRFDDNSPPHTSKSLPTPTSHHSPAKPLREVLSIVSPAQRMFDSSRFTQYDATLTRTIKDVTVQSYHIDDCYNIFLTHYGPHLDGLFEDNLTPNERYQQSPLLFWTILLVGSRGYSNDPTIYDRLGEHVLELAFLSMIRPTEPLPVIISAVILCTWPLPLDMIYRDPTQALAGAAHGLATQNGLHMYSREQDFVVKSLQSTAGLDQEPEALRSRMREAAVVIRTRIWVYCLLAFQNANIGDGLPPTNIVPCFRRAESFGEISPLLPRILGYRLQAHRIRTEAVNVIAGSCDIVGSHKDDSLAAMIVAFDGRVRELPRPEDNDIYNVIRCNIRLQIQSLIWLTSTEPDRIAILRVYGVAHELIAHMKAMNDMVQGFTFYVPHYNHRILILAASIILRVAKSPLAKDINVSEAEAAIFTVINIVQHRCLQSNDLYAIATQMLTQLWTSKKAFVREGKPQNGLKVDMRYRLVLNPVFDNFWWWRMEFGTTPSAPTKEQLQQSSLGSMPQSTQSFQTASGTENAMPIPSMAYTGPMPTALDGSLQSQAQLDNLFSDFMDWWDFSTIPTDMFQTDAAGMMMPQVQGYDNLYTGQ